MLDYFGERFGVFSPERPEQDTTYHSPSNARVRRLHSDNLTLDKLLPETRLYFPDPDEVFFYLTEVRGGYWIHFSSLEQQRTGREGLYRTHEFIQDEFIRNVEYEEVLYDVYPHGRVQIRHARILLEDGSPSPKPIPGFNYQLPYGLEAQVCLTRRGSPILNYIEVDSSNPNVQSPLRQRELWLEGRRK